MVEATVPNSTVTLASGASPDKRSYRVDFTKATTKLPGFDPQWSVQRGIEEAYEAYKREQLTIEEFLTSRFIRLARVKELIASGQVDDNLRWRTVGVEA
jgi:hypothetical protein